MARPAVLGGRTLADMVTNTFSIVVLLVDRAHHRVLVPTGIGEILLGVVLLLLFGYAFSWVFALPRAARLVARGGELDRLHPVFPLTFISSAFVPVESMPSALQWFAEINPFTIVVNAMRALWVDAPAEHYIWGAFAWSFAILLIFAPLAVARYRRAAGN